MQKQMQWLAPVIGACGLAALLGLAPGCSSIFPFDYPPSNRIQIGTYQPKCGARNLTFDVRPVEDLKPDHSTTKLWTLCSYIPLVPFIHYHDYEVTNCTQEALRDAVALHVQESGLGHPVIVPEGSAAARRCDYSLQVSIKELGTTGFCTCYCLGIFSGRYVTGYGVPGEYATAHCTAQVRLMDRAGRVVLDRTYADERHYVGGTYYNWNPYTFLGCSLTRILNAACRDMAQKVQPRVQPPRVQQAPLSRAPRGVKPASKRSPAATGRRSTGASRARR